MSDNANPSPGNGPGRSRLPLSRRAIGILIMVAGAAAFFYARVTFPDQVLCLGGSTLIVFAGLAIILAGRRSGTGSATVQSSRQEMPDKARPVFQRRIPRGLREEARRRTQAQPPVISTEEASLAETPVQPTPVVQGENLPGGALLDQVIALFDEQGAQVAIESQRDDAGGSRGILQVQSKDGLPYSVMVLEGVDPVDVAEVRALFALVSSSGSAGGYLVASAPFTPRAYEWAGARHIHLVQEDELNEMSI